MHRTYVLVMSVILSCNNPVKYTVWTFNDGCNLDKLEYQEITDTISSFKSGDLQTGVKANGKLYLNSKLNIDTLGANLHNGDKVFINQKTFKTVKVSQAFYEKYAVNRESLCQIAQGIKTGVIKTEEGIKKAENLYLDIISMFSGLRAQDEKMRVDEEKKKADSIKQIKW